MFLKQRLILREQQGLLRRLKTEGALIDFSSNDYLGLSYDSSIVENAHKTIKDKNLLRSGSGGSRLITGTSSYVLSVEATIAKYHAAEAALLFNSGYDANVGLLSCLAQQGDTILYDELSHASLHDGRRLSKARSFMFRHNDLQHLEERLREGNGEVFVVVESIYSMDGDRAPLREISELCGMYKAHLIVDEAHAGGIFGPDGAGIVQELGIETSVFARVVTFGKAFAAHGAVVLGSAELYNYLVNFARSFIYTTALPPHSIAIIDEVYKRMPLLGSIRNKLHENVGLFISLLNKEVEALRIPGSSPIQALVLSSNEKALSLAQILQTKGFDIRPILSPTVAKGKERLRICIHAFNTEEQLRGLCDSLNEELLNG